MIQNDLNKLKDFIKSQQKAHQEAEEWFGEVIEADIAYDILHFCAKYNIKAEKWDFPKLILDLEDDDNESTFWQEYANLAFDIDENGIEVDPIIIEIKDYYEKLFWPDFYDEMKNNE
jgi:hypothetical protein